MCRQEETVELLRDKKWVDFFNPLYFVLYLITWIAKLLINNGECKVSKDSCREDFKYLEVFNYFKGTFNGKRGNKG